MLARLALVSGSSLQEFGIGESRTGVSKYIVVAFVPRTVA